jgi:hypothetical protein
MSTTLGMSLRLMDQHEKRLVAVSPDFLIPARNWEKFPE